MNEEELFEQVDGRIHEIYSLGYNREGIPDSRNRIEEIIALVRADERQRIRDKLLDPVMFNESFVDEMESILDLIGITEEGRNDKG